MDIPREGPIEGDAISVPHRASFSALARHELPDGSWHLDWFIERPRDGSERRLITFRVMIDPRDPGATTFDAERIGDHRAVYLDYEGPVSGNRGSVTHIWKAPCVVELLAEQDLRLRLAFAGGARTLTGVRTDQDIPSDQAGTAWVFRG